MAMDVVKTDDGFRVPGVALVRAGTHRTPRQARELAQRIAGDSEAGDAASYLAVVKLLGQTGIVDERPGQNFALAG